jgi:ferric-dicitrate binding protein FerR (iron transport regulator)
MKATQGETGERQLENLGRMARKWSTSASTRDREPSSDGQTRQWLALERSMQRGARVAARRRFVGASAVALTAVAALLVARGLGRPDNNLSFVVSEGTASVATSVGDTVQPEQIPVRMSFSDGSDVILHPGARGAVIGTTKLGARVRLEEGRARFTVAHRPKTNWSVEAGPFTVVVHGTVFDVGWSRESGALAVDLLVGSVTIRGPVQGGTATGTITMTAGQRLTARASSGISRLSRIDQTDTVDPIAANGDDRPPVTPAGAAVVEPPGAAASPPPIAAAPEIARGVVPAPAPGEAPGGAINPRPAVRRQHAASPAAVSVSDLDSARRLGRPSTVIAGISASWAARVASGAFQGVVDEADAIGVELCLAKAPADSLAALADAARYVRRTDLARQALLAERRRFARSVGAHDAAFLIGRLAEDTGGDLREALLWYDRYLEQSQTGTYAGTYASEALGRKMLALDRLGEAADARVTAQRYLTAFPTGAFATRARRIQVKP